MRTITAAAKRIIHTRSRSRLALTAALCLAAIAAPSTTAVAAGAAAASSRPIQLVGCDQKAHARPNLISESCNSGDHYWDHLRWTSWGGATASATGIAHDNRTDSAGGPVRTTSVRLTLGRAVTHGGITRYSILKVQHVDGAGRRIGGSTTYRQVEGGFLPLPGH